MFCLLSDSWIHHASKTCENFMLKIIISLPCITHLHLNFSAAPFPPLPESIFDFTSSCISKTLPSSGSYAFLIHGSKPSSPCTAMRFFHEVWKKGSLMGFSVWVTCSSGAQPHCSSGLCVLGLSLLLTGCINGTYMYLIRRFYLMFDMLYMPWSVSCWALHVRAIVHIPESSLVLWHPWGCCEDGSSWIMIEKIRQP